MINRSLINTSGHRKGVTLEGNEYTENIPESANLEEGYILKTHQGYLTVTDDVLSTGLLLLGSTGNGKTATIFNLLDHAVPQMKNDVMIIFDAKGDFKKRYYNPMCPSHILVSVNSTDKANALSWNIYGECLNERGEIDSESELTALEVAANAFKPLISRQQPFFHLAGRGVFASIIIAFLRDAAATGDFSKLNNETLCSFLTEKTSKEILQFTAGRYSDMRYLEDYIGDEKSKQTHSVMSFIHAMVSNTFISTFRNRQPKGDFSIRKLIREKKGKIIFLEFDLNHSEATKTVYSLLGDLAIKEALSVDSPQGSTFFVCDEINLLPYCDERFELLVNYGRSKQCKTVVGLQSVSQLHKNYGKDTANCILAGMISAICFNTVDYESRTYIKHRLGESYKIYNYAGTNISREAFTVSDSDIINLDIGEAFVDFKRTTPFKVRFKDAPEFYIPSRRFSL